MAGNWIPVRIGVGAWGAERIRNVRARSPGAGPGQRVDVESIDFVARVVGMPSAPDDQAVSGRVVGSPAPRGDDIDGVAWGGGFRERRTKIGARHLVPLPRLKAIDRARPGLRGRS